MELYRVTEPNFTTEQMARINIIRVICYYTVFNVEIKIMQVAVLGRGWVIGLEWDRRIGSTYSVVVSRLK